MAKALANQIPMDALANEAVRDSDKISKMEAATDVRCRLDRWCASPGRTLIIWIVLTAVMSAVIDFDGGAWLRSTISFVRRTTGELSGWTPNSMVSSAWKISLQVALLHWFHPVLLRLSPLRAVAWISLFSIVLASRTLATPLWHDSFVSFLGLTLAAALPGLTLIGERTRPWMIVPAALLFTTAVMTLSRYLHTLIPVAANVPYAALLLYGTRPCRTCSRSDLPSANTSSERAA